MPVSGQGQQGACETIVLHEREEVRAMVARVCEALSAAHEACLLDALIFEVEAKQRLIQAEVERRHEEAMVARTAHSEATRSQVVE